VSRDESALPRIDRVLRGIDPDALPPVPSGGWIRAVRQALGMNARQLAQRVGVRVSTLLGAEKNEVSGAISMTQLRRVAAALDCELHYVLVPRESLVTRVDRRAEELATAGIASVAHSMSDDAQNRGEDFWEAAVADLKAQLLRGRRSSLWD